MLTQELDHALRSQERLTAQFKDKPNILKWINVFSQEIQQIEDELFKVIRIADIDYASGDVLDLIGAIVGLSRGSLNDADYREAIRSQIFVNRSDGSEQYVTAAFVIITKAEDFSVDEPYTATVRYEVDESLNPDFTADFIHNLRSAVAAGVKCFVLLYESSATAFRLDTGLGLGTSTSLIPGTHAALATTLEV